MKRALIIGSLVLLGGALWWSLRPGPGVTLPTPVDDRPPWEREAATGGGASGTGGAGTAAVDPRDAADAGPLPWLFGDVRDETSGVAQALIELHRRGESKETDCTANGSTHSVGGGTFELGPLCPGQYDVRASRGAQVATAAVRLSRGVEQERLLLTLREGTRLTVRTRDALKAPLPGVEVRVQDVQSGYQVMLTTDEKGVATASGLAPREHSLWAQKPNYLDASLYGRVLAAGDDAVELSLTAGVRFEGRVLGPDGAGLDDSWVRLATRRKELGGSFDTVESEQSHDGGEFSIGPVRPGAYWLVASHDDFQRSEQQVKVPGPRTTVKLGRGTTVEGMFLDADGAPVLEGEVSVEMGGNVDSRQADVDEFGHFKLEGIGKGSWMLLGIAKSTDGGAGPQGVAAAPVTVKQEPKLTVNLQLTRGVSIEGRCVNGDGTPADTEIVAAEASLFKKLKMTGFDASRVRTGTAAFAPCAPNFKVSGLNPGRYFLIACGDDVDPPAANTGDKDVVVTCFEGRLKFRVVDPAGKPVTKFGVGPIGELQDHPGGLFDGRLYGETDDVLTVRAPGFAALQRRMKSKRRENLDLGDLQLQPARKLAGVVTTAKDGKPVAGADVRFGVDHDDALQHARTGAEGRFLLDAVPRESGALFVTHQSFRSQSVPLSATQDQVAVALEAGLELSGAIITRDGRELRDVTVEARGPGGVEKKSPVTDGRYALGSLEPGDWKLRLNGAEVSAFDPLALTLLGSGTMSADFVERLGGVTVTVLPTDEDGQPIIALVWLLSGRRTVPATEAEAWRQATSAGFASEGDPSGTATFRSVPAGPYTVMARVKDIDGLWWSEALEVNPGMASVIRVPMPRGLQPLK